jgi:hypothetical protein
VELIAGLKLYEHPSSDAYGGAIFWRSLIALGV